MVVIGLIALAAILSWNFLLLLLAGFVFLAGQAELAAVRRREANRWADVLDVLPADDDSGEPMAHGERPLFNGYTWDSHYHGWVRWQNGRPVSFSRARHE